MVPGEITGQYVNVSGGTKYMVLSWNDSTSSESYYVQFSDIVQSSGINYTAVKYWSGGEWVTKHSQRTGGDTVSLGSAGFTINSVRREPVDRGVNITLDAGNTLDYLYTKEGLRIYLPWTNTSLSTGSGQFGYINISATSSTGHDIYSYWVSCTEEDKDDGVAKGKTFNITLDDNSNGYVEVSTISAQAANFNEKEVTTNTVAVVPSDLGTKVRRLGDTASQRTAEITYNGAESYAKIYISAPDTSFGGTGSTITPVYDNQLSSVNTKNLVVVGGSCVNTVAATLLGSSTALCGADWTSKVGASAGEYVIRTYKNTAVTSKLATLVAGWAKEDTANAAKALTTGTIEIADGKNYKGTTASNAAAV
jgi:hypothetical protein